MYNLVLLIQLNLKDKTMNWSSCLLFGVLFCMSLSLRGGSMVESSRVEWEVLLRGGSMVESWPVEWEVLLRGGSMVESSHVEWEGLTPVPCFTHKACVISRLSAK